MFSDVAPSPKQAISNFLFFLGELAEMNEPRRERLNDNGKLFFGWLFRLVGHNSYVTVRGHPPWLWFHPSQGGKQDLIVHNVEVNT